MDLANVEFDTSQLDMATDEREEILGNLRTLILTTAGTIPLNRNFGIDNSFLSMPIEAAKNVLAVEIMDKVDIYEPRVAVSEVDCTANLDGQITARVVVKNA